MAKLPVYMRKMKWKQVLGLLVIVLLTAGTLLFAAMEPEMPRAAGDKPSALPDASNSDFDVRRDAAVLAIQKVMPSVVNIATSHVVEYNDFYQDLLRQFYNWNMPLPGQEEYSIGSGVIVSKDGYVLTNLHVVRRASRIQVKLSDGRVYDADVKVVTPHSDLALLKLRCKPGETFQAIQFAKPDDLLLGETVLALGDPYGLGESVTRGILSSKSRRPPSADEPLNVGNWLQTDAAINPGNSGGPLIDLRGELIGINVAMYPAGHGIGFAIPVREVADALSQFFTPEVTSSLWFGAQIKVGAYPLEVASVEPGSPADKAGLRPGQQILEVNGQAPDDVMECNRLLTSGKTHDVSLVVRQNGEKLNLNTTLMPLSQMIQQKLGLALRPLTSGEANNLGLNTNAGLLIDKVDANSPAANANLQRGYLLTAIDGDTANQIVSVAGALSDKKTGDTVQLTVLVPRRVSDNAFTAMQGSVSVPVR
jgi:serine protease Do